MDDFSLILPVANCRMPAGHCSMSTEYNYQISPLPEPNMSDEQDTKKNLNVFRKKDNKQDRKGKATMELIFLR